jgi:hypothetical protein
MTSTDSTGAEAPPRKRGAPKGNRNAWKHGKRSASAKAARAVVSARVIEGLPDPNLFVEMAQRNQARLKRIGWDAALAQILPNKTNKSISAERGEGGAPIPPNKTNNSVAHDGLLKRGAPKGNRNAVKHGMKSAKRRAVDAEFRAFIRRAHTLCRLAQAMADTGDRTR